MQSFFSPVVRPSTAFRSSSCPPSVSRLRPLPSAPNSSCAVADTDTATAPDDLRLLHPPLQVVLLSNDTSFCSLTRAFLQHAGFSVYTCTTSDRAESLFLDRSDLQLWIIDVKALGIEAAYFATRVREQHPSMPILLISNEQRDSRTLPQFLLHGWTQLTKPIDLAKMLATINDLLANARQGSTAKTFSSGHPKGPEPTEPDWLNDLRRTNLSRMRN